jgi:transmembrane sensor
MLDEHADTFRDRMQPAWDDLRERRVLRATRQRLDERRRRSGARRRALSIAIPALLGIAALVVAYVAGIRLGQHLAMRGTNPPPGATVEAQRPPAPPPVPGTEIAETRVLSDGSRLELSRYARVEVRTETSSRVELAQAGGRVRYEVARVPTRAFVIHAGNVRVEVTGTVFVVSFERDKIAVHVERGRVRVSGTGKEAELGAGDELSFSAPDAPDGTSPASPERGQNDERTSPRSTTPPSADVPSASPERGQNDERTSPSASPQQPPARPEAAPATSVSNLLERADAERAAGDLTAAAATLREFVTRHPNDPRAALGWFTLGKVERTRARAVVAAKAFRTSFSVAPDGPLAEDALAEEAAAWAAANNAAEVHAAVERYLRRFPNGTHAARVRHLLE